ncbi:hypothetical protein CONLIGDRAFT_636944 [Coniochaeta ligniaria NRRL 30616]|uniref:Uncharacterized protein n=1 Tax=Coniochaeta ligniaria NRRL 30616 TaxID=1408157 RepID=A0A1J7I997_9PEZI|nr:hypothetical protein CONLIGDRAFT_636944 [Coniochaeta ligniaria NRRL 30616]
MQLQHCHALLNNPNTKPTCSTPSASSHLRELPPPPTQQLRAIAPSPRLPATMSKSNHRSIYFYPSQQNVLRGQNYNNATALPPVDTPPGRPHLPPFAQREASSSSDSDESSTDDDHRKPGKHRGRNRRGKKERAAARRRQERELAEGGEQGQEQERATLREVEEVVDNSTWERQQHQQEDDHPHYSDDEGGWFAGGQQHDLGFGPPPQPIHAPSSPQPPPPHGSIHPHPTTTLSDAATHNHNRLVSDLAPLAASSDYVAIAYRQVGLVADVMKGDAGARDVRAFNHALDEVAALYPAVTMPGGRCGMREFLEAFRVPMAGEE